MVDNKPKKILIIASEFPPNAGGIGNQAFNLALQLAENNFVVTVLGDINDYSAHDIKNADWFKKLNFIPVYRNKIILLTYFQRIQKAIALTRHWDVIILSGKFSIWLTGLLRIFYPRKKIIAVVHGTELRYKLINFSLAKCDIIVAVSHFTRSLIPSSILARTKCYVIPNGVDTDEFSAVQTEQKTITPN